MMENHWPPRSSVWRQRKRDERARRLLTIASEALSIAKIGGRQGIIQKRRAFRAVRLAIRLKIGRARAHKLETILGAMCRECGGQIGGDDEAIRLTAFAFQTIALQQLAWAAPQRECS